MKRILVTGGAGFIGARLCEKLLDNGDAVICLDSFATAHRDNLKAISNHPNFSLIEQDVCDPINVNVDEIYNLACPASPVQYQQDPVHTTRTSVIGALNVLDLARRLDAPVLQTSTSEVYGNPLVHPQTEQYFGHVNPIGTRACYDEGKRCAESLFFDYHREYGVQIKVARIFNTYGPGMAPDDGRVVSNFIMQALSGDPITVYGEGEQTRSFCFRDDMVAALMALMASPANVTGPVNLGNPNEATVLELAETIIRLTGAQSELVFEPLPQDDPVRRRPDISLAKSALGWAPTTDLAAGLDATIAFFQSQIDARADAPTRAAQPPQRVPAVSDDAAAHSEVSVRIDPR